MNWLLKNLKKFIREHKFLYLYIIFFCCDIQPFQAISGTLFIENVKHLAKSQKLINMTFDCAINRIIL